MNSQEIQSLMEKYEKRISCLEQRIEQLEDIVVEIEKEKETKLEKEIKEIYRKDPSRRGLFRCIVYHREQVGNDKPLEESRKSVEKILKIIWK